MAVHRIILADDHAMLRAGLKSLINQEVGLKVIAEAQNGEDLIKKLGTFKCDLVVLDLSMPKLDGMQALIQIRQQFKKVQVLVLTMQKDHEHLKQAMAKGALGYVLKEDAYEQLVVAIKSILRGKKFISPSVSTLITEQWFRSVDDNGNPSLEILTKRELQVLKLVASGLANKNISTKLRISVRTVETHRAHLTDKLKIKSLANLVKYAISKGLI